MKPTTTRKRKTRESLFSSDSEENADDSVALCDEIEGSESLSSLNEGPMLGNFVLVRFPIAAFYVGEIISTPKKEELEISFYRYNKKMNAFSKPVGHDEVVIPLSDVHAILQLNVSTIRTKRLAGFMRFLKNLDIL